MITTPCPVCQIKDRVYRTHINKKYATDYNIPVVCYSQMMSFAYGGSVQESGLNGQIIRAKKFEDIAKK